MKKRNRIEIVTAALAVLSIQEIGFKKRIGIITAVLAVLLLASMPTQASIDPPDCTTSTLSILSLMKNESTVKNGDVVRYAIWVGTAGAGGGCNNDGIRIQWAQPGLDGLPNLASILTLDSGKSFPANGAGDLCYFESATGSKLCDVFAAGVTKVQRNGIDWTVNVNNGVTIATARAIANCPSHACLHDAIGRDDDVSNSKDLSVIIMPEERKPPAEFWEVEWFHTKPDQYTEFFLPSGQLYMVTSGFRAPEAETKIWDGDPQNEVLVDEHTGDRLKYWQDPEDMTDLYVNKFIIGNREDTANIAISDLNSVSAIATLRLYGTFGEGAGDLNKLDPVSGKMQENPGYTNPIAPFFPQADQAPRKDFVTFNPAIMEQNFGYPELLFSVDGNTVQEAKEKVFQRMWYEKEWFKDDNADGHWNVVIEACSPENPAKICPYVTTLPLDDTTAIKNQLERGNRIREHNNHILTPENRADTYGPAIIKEFTYMTLNTETQPVLVQSGSRILIPTANDPARGFGLNEFTYTGKSRDYVKVESEKTLNLDIDGDGNMKPMDIDGQEVSGDESLVLVLPDKQLTQGDELQFFDNKIQIVTVSTGSGGSIVYNVCPNEGGTIVCTNNENLNSGDVKFYTRAVPQQNPSQPKGDFYIRLKNVDNTLGQPTAVIEVGRLFGNTLANIGANKYWNQKAFFVQGVFYNVVAIKAKDNTFKYITFREKLPKEDIKLYGRDLEVWDPGISMNNILPEMPPFNMDHDIMEDVQTTHTMPIQKIGAKKPAHALRMVYINEAKEPRFFGELKEIYAESLNPLKEFWEVEWFHTKPDQYTEFIIAPSIPSEKYLVTTGFTAPEAETKIWDGDPQNEVLVDEHTGDRLKFWFDPLMPTGLFINNANGAVRLYGTFGEGAGDLNKLDPVSGKMQENPGYTNPIAPFFPQAEQAPRKDFVTFNPAIMEHNFGYPELLFSVDGNTVQEAKEKVFQRMWYEKEWFKDDNADGHWNVVIEACSPENPAKICPYVTTLPLDDTTAIKNQLERGNRIREHNNHILTPENRADTYGPAIIKEFTYMTLNTETQPVLVQSGSRILIPTANDPARGFGLNDFTYTGKSRDYVKVESEETLNLDIDGDGNMKPMDIDGQEVSGDESLVLVLPDKQLTQGDELQFFDNKIQIVTVSTGNGGSIVYNVCPNEGGTAVCTNTENLKSGDVKFYTRAVPRLNPSQPKGDFYIRLKNVDNTQGQPSAVIEVGRLFGNTLANIGANKYWNQKAFFVQGVFYNVVAIKAQDNTFKYITFREKLPKEDIKLYGTELNVWEPGFGQDNVLPEMPPFNMDHRILQDVQSTHSMPIQKIGDPMDVGRLTVSYGTEAKEPRFFGELKEIYAENITTTPPSPPDGAALYAANCAGCHGPLATSTKLGRTAAQIQAAISTVPQMSSLPSLRALTSAQIQAIADALATQPALDGAALYKANCEGCHGPLATSTKLGRTAAQIQAAISTVPQMSSLSSLSQAQIQAIADALATTETIANLDHDPAKIVDIGDAGVLIGNWGAKSTDSDWNDHKMADLDESGEVDIGDAGKLIGNWNKAESS